jgi:hypothetical protein
MAPNINIFSVDNSKTERQQEQREKKCRECEDIYDNLEETAPITVSNGQVIFRCHFKYIGSHVSFCLCDNCDIDNASPMHPNP